MRPFLKKFHISRAAIWRFKEENRALMRRLYGDMESTSVYREMRQMTTNIDDQEQDSSRSSIVLGSGFMPDLFSSLESKYNIRMGSGLATGKLYDIKFQLNRWYTSNKL